MAKSTKLTLFLLFAIIVFTSSCKKQNPQPHPIDEDKIDIYIAGSLYKDGDYFPGYLKNNEPVFLSTDKTMAGIGVFRIVVDNGDVYAVGSINGLTGLPIIWKNGEVTLVGRNYQSAYITGIAVNNGDVYVSGAGYNPSVFYYNYWKNGQAVNLNNEFRSVQDIGVKSGSAVVLGNLSDNYWPYAYGYIIKNNFFRGLKDCVNAHHLFVAGNNVYVSGADKNGYVSYWKNEQRFSTTEKFSSWDRYKITVDKEDVYMCGMGTDTVNANAVSVIKYWKNTRSFSPKAEDFEPSTRVNGHLYGIAGYNGNAYTIGEVYDQRGHSEAALFKNTERIPINKTLAYARDIVIKEK